MNRRQRTNVEAIAAAIVIVFCVTAFVCATTFHVILAPPPGTRPVHRFWNNQLGTHFYTMNEAERTKLVNQYSHVWIYEGVGFFAWPDPNGLNLEGEQ